MVFVLSTLWWMRIGELWKLPDGKDWLWGKLGLVPVGKATLSSVQSLSHVWLLVTLWTAAHQASIHQQLLELTQTHIHWVSDAILPSIFPRIRAFSNESILHIRWSKYWGFSFSISLSNEYSGLISFRMDWLDLLGVQGTLKSLLQHHSSKASILQCSAFLYFNSLIHTWLLEKPQPWLDGPLLAK